MPEHKTIKMKFPASSPDLTINESPFAILELPSNWFPCVLNMITYLIGDTDNAAQYIPILKNQVKGTVHQNIRTEEFFMVFDEASLWNDFFLDEPTLSEIIHKRGIDSFEMLAYRTQEYFEKSRFDYYPNPHY